MASSNRNTCSNTSLQHTRPSTPPTPTARPCSCPPHHSASSLCTCPNTNPTNTPTQAIPCSHLICRRARGHHTRPDTPTLLSLSNPCPAAARRVTALAVSSPAGYVVAATEARERVVWSCGPGLALLPTPLERVELVSVGLC